MTPSSSSSPSPELPIPPPIRLDELVLSCGSPTQFNLEALNAPVGAEDADHPVAKALRELIGDDALLAKHGWRLVFLSDSAALFVHIGELADEGSHLNAEFEGSGAFWRPVGWGGCILEPVFEGLGSARWELAPGLQLDGDATVIDVLVTEQGCASGWSPAGRIAPAGVIYGADAVTMIFGVRPLQGAQTCEPGPAAPFTVRLSEALGARRLLDGSLIPPEQRWPAP